jgi:hypothetical protein
MKGILKTIMLADAAALLAATPALANTSARTPEQKRGSSQRCSMPWV